jgi:hypothetical protein
VVGFLMILTCPYSLSCLSRGHPAALNEDFNLSTPTSTTVLELAQILWSEIRGDEPRC